MKEVTIKHYGKIVKGVKHYYNPKLYSQNLLELEGKEFEEVLREKHKRVSQDAHGYYRGGVLGTAMSCEMFAGWERDDIHDFFARMFLAYTKTNILIMPGGTTKTINVRKVDSTASLNSRRMKEFTDKCIQWLAEHNVIVLSPEDYYLGKYKTDIIKPEDNGV
jgi:hypothetical protein